MAIKYTQWRLIIEITLNIQTFFYFKATKFPQIWIFGMQIYHLATLRPHEDVRRLVLEKP
jgi:hypothetical protein